MTKKPNYVFDDELYHWGIKGQRWGERRFQNEDGSWTPEGRERYGKGDGERVKIEKAKATYETQKYKANLKSKAQKEKDKRAAAEERNRIKEQAKTNKLIKKEQAKLDQQGSKKFRNTKKMSDEDLASAIDRLKLQSEYNKQYALAKKPDGALAKADRFFEGPTGKAVTQIAVAVLPNVAQAATTKILESKLKYANKLDREKMEADIDKVRAEAEAKRNPVNNKGTKEHDQAVKDRAERMFGKNKDVSKESVNKNPTGTQSGKTGIKGEKWDTISKKANNIIDSNANSTNYKKITFNKDDSILFKNADPTKTLGDITGWTKEYTVNNVEYKKKLFGKK